MKNEKINNEKISLFTHPYIVSNTFAFIFYLFRFAFCFFSVEHEIK